MNLPADAEIPALEKMRDTGPDPLLNGAGLKGSFQIERLLRHHPGRRCTVAIKNETGTVVFKAYREGHQVERLLAVMMGLDGAGLDANAGPEPARILGFDTKHRFVVTDWFDGPSGRDLIESGHGRRAGELAAIWVKDSRIGLGHFPTIERPLPAIERAGQMIASMRPGVPRVARLATVVLEKLASDPPRQGAEVLCHGSCKPGHIFDLGGRPGLIDWESARAGPAELDAGTFLGKLTSLRIRHPRLAPELTEARLAFLNGAGDVLDPPSIVWYEAFAQLKRAALASRRRGHKAKEKSERLLDEAMSLLSSQP